MTWLIETSSGKLWMPWVIQVSSSVGYNLCTQYSVAEMSNIKGSDVANSTCDIQSIRKGCPLSMHIFVLFIEPLVVRWAQFSQGIRVIDQTLTARAFVNDITIFLSSDSDVARVEEILDLFWQSTTE
jgi:hypothetical protein